MKNLIMAVLAMAIIASVSFAGDYDHIRSGSMGYVSFQEDIAAYTQLKAGDSIFVWNLNEATLKIGCGIGTVTSGKIDKAGINYFGYTAPTSDLYQVFCYKISGLAGNTYLAVLDDISSDRKANREEVGLSNDEMKKLTEKLKESRRKE